ncbi:MAG: hypothetical protein IH946_05900 [Bacteroidetes bacterium]|nr:hypothetical protein [Bacteroidota bacterium]
MKNLITLASAFLIIFSTINISQAAICSLRNPDRDIYQLFPGATGYEIVYGNIVNNSDICNKLEEELGKQLSLNDIGTHTFYVIMNESTPIGFIHARAEWAKYGNVEIIWAFNLDGSIKDYKIQRSREKGTLKVMEPAYRKQFIGKKKGDSFDVEPIQDCEVISSAILISAKKTLLVNSYVFYASIQKAQNCNQVLNDQG